MKVKVTLIVGGIILGICALLALSILLMMGGADFTEYPSKRASDWVCEDPHFEIHFGDGADEDHLVWEGEKIPVITGLRANGFNVFLKTDPQQPLDKCVLLRGTWKYEKGNMVVRIEEDNIFDGAYTELVFVPQ